MIDRELAAWRREARARLLALRRALSPEDHCQKSSEVMSGLEARWSYLTRSVAVPNTVGAYWPMAGEIDLRPFLHWLREQGCTLALPAVVGRGLPLEFRSWRPGDPLAAGPFGTEHPAQGEPLQPAVVLLPLVGFDEGNYRLGYGGGYYDRTLAAMEPKPLTIGLGFELSRLATIHPQAHDVALDYIVTELA